MPCTCLFVFDRSEPLYHSGETVSGRIKLSTTNEISCRDIYIEFLGEAKVHWEERYSSAHSGKSTSSKHYRSNQIYLHTRNSIFSGGALPAGIHEFTFSIPLPIDCPTSCIEAHGHITYELSLVISRALRFDNVFKQRLTVLKALDLNNHIDLLIPLQGEDIKYICCGFCSTGPVISTLYIPFGGYIPGQEIKYKLQIDNQSYNYDTKGIYIIFSKLIKFIVSSPFPKTRTVEKQLSKVTHNEVCLRLTKRIFNGSFHIPIVPPTLYEGIINISYNFAIYIQMGNCHLASKIVMPLMIGTVPLVQNTNNHIASNQIETINYAQIINVPLDKPPSYDYDDLPSFEEATLAAESVLEDRERC